MTGFPKIGVSVAQPSGAVLFALPHVGYGPDKVTDMYGPSMVIANASAGTSGTGGGYWITSYGCGSCSLDNHNSCSLAGTGGTPSFIPWSAAERVQASLLTEQAGSNGLRFSTLAVRDPNVGDALPLQMGFGTGGTLCGGSADAPGTGAALVWLNRAFRASKE